MRRHQRRVDVLVIITLVVASVVTFGAGPASADDYGYSNNDGNGPVPLPDSQDHWFCLASIPNAEHRDIIRGSMGFLDDATNMHDVETSTCGASTDIWWYTADISGGALGRTSCESWAFWSVCDRWKVIVDNEKFFVYGAQCGSSPAVVEFNYIHTVRHELGHTVGLHHTPAVVSLCDGILGNDAMTSDWINANFFYLSYNNDHVGHINCVCG